MIELVADTKTTESIERGARCIWYLSNQWRWEEQDERTRGLYRAAWVAAAAILNSKEASDLFYEIHPDAREVPS